MRKVLGLWTCGCNRKTIISMLVVAIAVMSLAGPMFAQNANGRIAGTVKDQTGGSVAGAMITVTDVARGLARNLTTDESGAYSAPNLIPGTYSVRATFTGFQAWERTNIKLEVSQDLNIDVVLQPGAQTQTVTVTEELPIVNTSSSTLGGTLSNESINDLPISGRNYQNLLELRPGVVLQLGNNSDGGGPAATNGLRAEASNQYQVEGLAGMDPYTGQSVINNIGVDGDAASLLPVDAIQEFNQQFNPKASYGYKAGSSVSVGLKSGTNALHGTAYGFFRNSAMDSTNYFNPVGVDINSNARQYGATVGGPIKKDKLFFFLGYEEMNLSVGNPTSVQAFFTDPSMLNCSGVNASYTCTPKAGLFPNIGGGNLAPDASNDLTLACLAIRNSGQAGVGLSPQSLSMMGMDQFCQMPGGTSGSGQSFAAGHVNPDFFVDHGATDHGAQAPGNATINTMYPNNDTTVTSLGSLAKLDYQVNAKNSINGFFYRGFGERFDGLGSQPSNRYRTDFQQYPMVIGGTWTYLVNSSLINSVRIGYAVLNQPNYSLDEEQGLTAAQLGLNTGVNRFGQLGLPQAITPTGFYSIGGRESDFQGPGRSTEYTEQISYLKGQHALMFGGTLIVDHQDAAINAFAKGSFVFGSAASGTQSASGLVAFLSGENQVPCLAPGTLSGGVCSNGFVVTNGSSSSVANNSGLQTATLLYGDPAATMRRKNYSAYVQDDWRIKPRVTLNLGLRYDLSTILRTDGLDFSTFDPNLAGGLAQEGNQIPALYQPDHNNFSPRLGVAWDMFGNGKTVLRGGSSIIYELLTLRTYFEVGNALGLAGNPTSWITGCSTALNSSTTIGANGTNCPGTLITPGGNRNVGMVQWAASSGTIVANPGGNSVLWDRATPAATTIYPGTALLNCNPNIFTQDTAGATPRPGATCPVGAVNSNLASPYVETWTASIQQALKNNLVLEVAYVGNHGVDSVDKINLNQPLPGAGWTPALVTTCNQQMITSACTKPLNTLGTTLRPYATKFPWLGDVTNTGNYDTSRYNALQVTLTARNYHGLFLVSGYTWSHSLSYADVNNGGFGVDAYNHSLDYGNSTQDLRHRFTVSPSYSLPGMKGLHGLFQGWKLNGNFKAQSGRPLTFTSTTDYQGTGRGTSRWNLLGDAGDFTTDYAANVGLVRNPKLAQFYPGCAVSAVTDPSATCSGAGELPAGINPRTGAAYVLADLAVNNPTCMASATKYNSLPTMRASGCWVEGNSALTPPAVGTFGNTTRDEFHGLPYWDMDASIAKRQTITERFSAEFRAELYNVFNHPAFGQPAAAIGGCTTSSCTFQTITNTPDVAATNPILGQGGPRRIQFGIKIIF